jgi:hypothetical protein
MRAARMMNTTDKLIGRFPIRTAAFSRETGVRATRWE